MLQIACGMLGWSPSEFWAASMAEYAAAVEGAAEKASGGETAKSRLAPEELFDLMTGLPTNGE